jgi:Raf kinase inhibitor-like YbhB/YbcL family protein
VRGKKHFASACLAGRAGGDEKSRADSRRPDAPDPKAPKRVWVHWLLYNIPPGATGLAENADKSGLPAGTVRGVTDSEKAAYGGPCPPIGRHRYFHRLYALDTTLDLAQASKAELEAAMKGHVLAQAELIGTYQKGDR